MKHTSSRVERTAEQIQRKLSVIIQQEVRDPRLPGFISISGVELSKDSSHAKVYFSAFSADPIQATSILNAAAGYLRTAMARTLDARVMPQLHFVYDDSLEQGRRLSQLIKDADKKNTDDNS